MDRGDQQNVQLNPLMISTVDKEEAFENQKTQAENTIASDQNEIGIMDLEFHKLVFFKELFQTVFQPFTWPISYCIDGQLGVSNRKIGILDINSFSTIMFFIVNSVFLSKYNVKIIEMDVAVINLLFGLHKIISALKYAQMTPEEQNEQNCKLLSDEVIHDHEIISWRNPDAKYLHFSMIKAEFICGINMSKIVYTTFSNAQNVDEFSEDEKLILNKIRLSNLDQYSQSLRQLIHVLIFKSKVFQLTYPIILHTLVQLGGPMILRYFLLGLPDSNWVEILTFYMMKLGTGRLFFLNLISLDAARVDLERRNIWIHNIVRIASPKGHADFGITYPLTKPNNVLCFLSLLTQVRMIGLQFYSRLQKFTWLFLLLISIKQSVLIIKLVWALMHSESLDQDFILLLIEIAFETGLVSIQLIVILHSVRNANESTQYATSLINRNKIYLQKEIHHIKHLDEYNYDEYNNKHLASLSQIRNSSNVKSLFNKIQGDHFSKNPQNVSNEKNHSLYNTNKETDVKFIDVDPFSKDENGLSIELKVNKDEINNDNNTNNKQIDNSKTINNKKDNMNREDQLSDLESSVEMCQSLSEIIKDEHEKYPQSILGMTDEYYFINFMGSMIFTVGTLFISVLLNV